MYSLGEIEALCIKASRGAGLSWGLAEEAGLIARHLSEVNLPGSDSVYTNLKFIEDNGWEDNLIDIKFLDQIRKPIVPPWRISSITMATNNLYLYPGSP